MPHLESLAPKSTNASDRGRFPFTVPVIRSLGTVDLSSPVTFFVGENGSGKSTLLEALALAAQLPTVGTEEVARDPLLESQRRLADALRLTWKSRTRRGFFLRAEDFFGFQRRLVRDRADYEAGLVEIDREFEDRSDHAKGLAKGPDARSHGESFLNLFQGRFVPGSLVLLDEPEAALSPQNQLGLVAMLMAMVKENAQFVIATHSPIVLALPGARIYSSGEVPGPRSCQPDSGFSPRSEPILAASRRLTRTVRSWGRTGSVPAAVLQSAPPRTGKRARSRRGPWRTGPRAARHWGRGSPSAHRWHGSTPRPWPGR